MMIFVGVCKDFYDGIDYVYGVFGFEVMFMLWFQGEYYVYFLQNGDLIGSV